MAAIDEALFLLVQDGTAEIDVNGQRYKSSDLDQLRRLRVFYADLADRDALRGTRRGPIIQAFR